MPMPPERETVEKAIAKLKEAVSLTQLAELAGVSESTVGKWVAILEAEGKIEVKDYGSVKLVIPSKKRDAQ